MEKANCLIFLEDHSIESSIGDLAEKYLNLEGKLAILTENRPYSKQNKALQAYASALKTGKTMSKATLYSLVRASKDYFKPGFNRQIELIDFAHDRNLEFLAVPIDGRFSKKVHEQFLEEDKLFSRLLKEHSVLDKRTADFFEEHALGAWYTQKKINQLKSEGFSSFVGSIGYSHYASLAFYLAPTNPKFILLPQENLVISYYRMLAFFLPEFREKFCLYCGKQVI